MDEEAALTFIQEGRASCFLSRAADQSVLYRSNTMKVGKKASLILEPFLFPLVQ